MSCGLALLLLTMLASCVTTDPRLVAALQQSSVREIRIETAPDVKMTGLFTEGKPDPQLPMVVRTLKTAMEKELTGLPGGPTYARLVVTLHVVDLSTKAGRILIHSDSDIAGTVRLEDAKTGRLIAENPDVVGSNSGMRGEGLGIVVAMAVNAAETVGPEDILAQRLSNDFTRRVKAWLLTKK
ncbi:hypothetical protein [Rhizobium mayense]|uniref:DUF3313 domain-containing protein n=1 Tax=Rhizobium mayense TaxID=1312184 RepID=A0ABT7JXE8_9HYPH|nr:hypothetical protein [Rhizobium mayense]MDL2400987.1 hypothetical protein [Rhizobium mayense]